MIELNNIKCIYFVGIGGIGMSSLAKYFYEKGMSISGFDDNLTEITRELEKKGIKVENNFTYSKLSPDDSTLIVYTPAINPSHKVLKYFIDHNFQILKRSDVLGSISKDTKTLAVAGTHGKTTTCSMLAHMLEYNNIKFTAFIGGVAKNFNDNFVNNNDDLIIVEADEYDRTFLQLYPDVAVITSIDSDHLDIYKTFDNLKEAFVAFSNNVKSKGVLISNKKLDIDSSNTFSIKSKATYWIDNIEAKKNGVYKFDIHYHNEVLKGQKVSLFGKHNINNFLAAFSVAHNCGLSIEQCVNAMHQYKGVKRRFEVHINTKKCVLIDDYAHHPVEIINAINTTKEFFGSRKIMCVFQPHLYSRTKDYAVEFGDALSLADELIVVDIYPAREKPIEGVSGGMLLNYSSNKVKMSCSKNELLKKIELSKAEVFLILGAGDISEMVLPVKKVLENKLKAA